MFPLVMSADRSGLAGWVDSLPLHGSVWTDCSAFAAAP
ncbi:hypothetical protein SynMITS9220_00830 [Synechococcus sp. MIT S9220]|nr:hypothetical protein SynMITS9220_00830 [Synechococcus sp. MIT S9220]